MEPARIRCCVPFCGRTTKDNGLIREWICGPHWRPTPKRWRLRKARVLRIRKAAVLRVDEPSRLRAEAAERRLWQKLKAAAIESAVGIR